jgi:hypothetical protein
VLSQIFSLVNVHLSRDAKCRQRQLGLATLNPKSSALSPRRGYVVRPVEIRGLGGAGS